MYNTKAVKGGSTIRPFLFCGKLSQKAENALLALGYTPVLLPPFSKLPTPVASHPDMLLFPYGEGFLTAGSYYREHREFFDALSLPLTLTEEEIGAKYPHDVLLNAFAIEGKIFGGKHISKRIASLGKHIAVAQGYARCSVSFFGKGSVTSDPSLYAALTAEGVDTLLIEAGNILLEGYGYGFIGGASLTLSPTLTAFFGRLEDHPDFERMQDFAAKKGVTLLSLTNEPLTDCGGGFLYPFKT